MLVGVVVAVVVVAAAKEIDPSVLRPPQQRTSQFGGGTPCPRFLNSQKTKQRGHWSPPPLITLAFVPFLLGSVPSPMTPWVWE